MRSLVLLLLLTLLWGLGHSQESCTTDDLVSITTPTLPLGSFAVGGICVEPPLRMDIGYTPRPDSPTAPAGIIGATIQNDFSAPFCLAATVFLLDGTSTGPLLHFFSDAAPPQPIGSLLVETTGVIFMLNGQTAVFPGDFSDWHRIQLCSNGAQLSLYENCTILLGTQPFTAPPVPQDGVLSFYEPLFPVTNDTDFTGTVQQPYIVSCTSGVAESSVLSGQCIKTPDCDQPANDASIQSIFNEIAHSTTTTPPPPMCPIRPTCTADDLVSITNLRASSFQVSGICAARMDIGYARIPDSPAAPTGVFGVGGNPIRNNFSAPFCLAATVFVSGDTGPLLHFFSDAAPPQPIGSLLVETTGVTFMLNGQTATFPGDFSGWHRIQLCSNGTRLSLYEDCTTPRGTQQFLATPVPQGGSLSFYRPIFPVTNGVNFTGTVQQPYIVSCTSGVDEDIVRLGQCIATPDCDQPRNTASIQAVFDVPILPPPPMCPTRPTCTVDDLVDITTPTLPLGSFQFFGICPDRRDTSYARRPDSPAAPAGVFGVGGNPIRNDFSAPFCLAATVFLIDFEGFSTGPLLHFFSDGQVGPPQPIGSLLVETTGVTFMLNGQTAVFPGDFSGWHRIQLCSNGTQLSLYENCTILLGTQPFTATPVPQGGVLTFYQSIFPVTNGANFTGTVQQPFIVSCTSGVAEDTVRLGQCVATPDCDEPANTDSIQAVFDGLTAFFQLRVGPLQHCQQWMQRSELVAEVERGIRRAVAAVIAERCSCSFSAECIAVGTISCSSTLLHQIVYRSVVLPSWISVRAVEILQEWVGTSSAVIDINPFILAVDSSCPVCIESLSDPPCDEPDTVCPDDFSLVTRDYRITRTARQCLRRLFGWPHILGQGCTPRVGRRRPRN